MKGLVLVETDSLCSVRYLYCGVWAGKLFFLVMIVDFLFWRLLELWQPAEDIEEMPDLTLPHISNKETLQETE
ncbi:hypothetical protein Ahy_B08g091314 isoform B [Arachis hypogaea]|uniref:Uncharacterized protein n=1 Tax=Arachis hypogaea TaxID=3818 RepID=A0A444Y1W2_ARAHY|nr:hypothetical protein Ahy_B08g091314 isoform B [Arachis hypogaea]